MASAVKFKFSGEQLRGDSHGETPAATGGLVDSGMWGDRTKWATEARQDGIKWVPDLKYSVINAFADTWACFCCGRWSRLGMTRPSTIFGCTLYRMSWTRAQWIWIANLVCLLVHSVWAYLCFTSCNSWRFGVHINENCTAAGMTIHVQRFAVNWTGVESTGYSVGLVDNGMPIRFDHLTGSFFILSAVFHGLAVLAGPFDRFAVAYWKQLDNALAPWRWIEYSASASVMVMALFLISGIREQNSLAMAFMLMWSVQAFGLLTEMYSRPDKRESDGYRGWKGDPVRDEQLLMIERKRRSYRDRNNLQREEAPREYAYDQTMAMQSATTRYEWENQRLNSMPPPMTYEEQKVVMSYRMAYTRNYVRRMIPHTLGIFPYVTIWVIFLHGFFTQLSDLQQGDADLFEQVPDWVPVAIVGTVVIFSSFTVVQWRYQWLSPDYYWKTELWYCFLSLTAKVFLGSLLYINVLAFSSVGEALADTAAARARIPPPSAPPPMVG